MHDLPVLAARPGQPQPGGGRRTAAAEKEAWVSRVLREWGSCGRVVLVDERTGGLRDLCAADVYLPGAAAFPTAPVSPDAVLLTTV